MSKFPDAAAPMGGGFFFTKRNPKFSKNGFLFLAYMLQ